MALAAPIHKSSCITSTSPLSRLQRPRKLISFRTGNNSHADRTDVGSTHRCILAQSASGASPPSSNTHTGVTHRVCAAKPLQQNVGVLLLKPLHRLEYRRHSEVPAPEERPTLWLCAAAGFLNAPEQQEPAFAALAVLHAGLAAATTLTPGWSLQHLLGLHPLAAPAGSINAAAKGMLVVAGAYLWLMSACLICLKVCCLPTKVTISIRNVP